MDDIWETVSRGSTRPSTAREPAQNLPASATQQAAAGTARGSPSPPRSRAAAPFEPSSRCAGSRCRLEFAGHVFRGQGSGWKVIEVSRPCRCLEQQTQEVWGCWARAVVLQQGGLLTGALYFLPWSSQASCHSAAGLSAASDHGEIGYGSLPGACHGGFHGHRMQQRRRSDHRGCEDWLCQAQWQVALLAAQPGRHHESTLSTCMSIASC